MHQSPGRQRLRTVVTAGQYQSPTSINIFTFNNLFWCKLDDSCFEIVFTLCQLFQYWRIWEWHQVPVIHQRALVMFKSAEHNHSFLNCPGLLFPCISPSSVFLRPSAPTTTSNSKPATGWSAGRIAALHPIAEKTKSNWECWVNPCTCIQVSNQINPPFVMWRTWGTSHLSRRFLLDGLCCYFKAILNLSNLAWRGKKCNNCTIKGLNVYILLHLKQGKMLQQMC